MPDVVLLTDDETSHAYRPPLAEGVDVFAPSQVYWWYGRSSDVGMVWVVRALLTLSRPDEPDGLLTLVPAPPYTAYPAIGACAPSPAHWAVMRHREYEGQRTVMTVDVSSARQEWSIPGSHMT